MSKVDQDETLLQVLIGGGFISREDVSDCKSIARDLKIPVLQAVKTSGLISENHMNVCRMIVDKVEQHQITVDLAIRAVRICNQKGISIEKAIREAKEIHEQTSVNVFEANELTKLLLSAHVVTNEQYSKTMIKARTSSMMLGQALIIDRIITTDGLLAALNAILMIRDSGLSESNAISALRYAYKKDISFEQALFELGTFIAPDEKTIRIGEFFLMAGLITKEDLAECLEIELFKKKRVAQIFLERGLVTQQHLEAAIDLLSSVSNNILKPHQATSALKVVCKDGKDIYAAMAEYQGAQQNSSDRLGDMLVDAEVLSRSEIELVVKENFDSAMKVGANLMRTKMLDEPTLHAALRLQTSVRLGYLSRDKAIALLRFCRQNKVPIEEAFTESHTYVPGRMQWTWV